MKIDQKRVRHSWLTRATVGDKEFGVKHLSDGRVRVFVPFGGSVRRGAVATDFGSFEDAVAFMDPPRNVDEPIVGEVVDLRTEGEAEIADDLCRAAKLAQALEGETKDLEDVVSDLGLVPEAPALSELVDAEMERTGDRKLR